MPRMDGTGPAGQGPGTGRGLGPCSYNGMRNFYGNTRPILWFGRLLSGFGFGRGMGRNSFGCQRRGAGRRRV
jgi:hypothetical protein